MHSTPTHPFLVALITFMQENQAKTKPPLRTHLHPYNLIHHLLIHLTISNSHFFYPLSNFHFSVSQLPLFYRLKIRAMASDGQWENPFSNAELSRCSATGEHSRASARSYMLDSIRGLGGLSGMWIDSDDLRRRILIPTYLRRAMYQAILSKNVFMVVDSIGEGMAAEDPPEAPIVVFVNSRSGGRHGPMLKERLLQLMVDEQVFDLSFVQPLDFVDYGLACLEALASRGDICAKVTREKLRIMVAGGDGTVGWVLGSIANLYKHNREPAPPAAIIPLGTGNDLSRSFGWGGSFSFSWRAAIKRSIYKAATGPVSHLDSWRLLVSMPMEDDHMELPHSLKRADGCPFFEDRHIGSGLVEAVTCFEGVFYNYFSIGMDAQVAYGFHHLRDEKPYLANGPLANKLVYSGYSCTQGWFCTPCLSDPSLRSLNNIVQIHVKKVNCSDWERIRVPPSVRAIVALNLHSYASGRNPWGQLKLDYMEKRGFVEAHADDGLLEIFGLKQGWHASFVMVELISAKHIAQATAIRIELRGGQWRDAYMQMDGEPWKQPIKSEYSTFVDIRREPFQSLMINGE